MQEPVVNYENMLYAINLLDTLVTGNSDMHELILNSTTDNEMIDGLTLVSLFLLQHLENKTGTPKEKIIELAQKAALMKHNS